MTLSRSRWSISDQPDRRLVEQLVQTLNVPRVLASLVAQRGHSTPEEAKRFLRPSLDSLHDPRLLQGMDRAVEILARAVGAGETIFVHGDYDVDGQCAVALLTRTLRVANASVVPFVPHRIRDGYDFGSAGIEAAKIAGATVIVTCDCGITARDAVSQAVAEGFKVIVTDHHLPGELPPADAVINPKQPGCAYPCKDLCGTGVIFKLAQALIQEFSLSENLQYHLLDLAALATVADIVPLRDENRVIVHHGLKVLVASQWPGIRALLESSGLTGKVVTAGQVGFILAPRLNAVGRISDANKGVELLLTDDGDQASKTAELLERLNSERKSLDQRTLDEAIEMAEVDVDLENEFGIVLASDGWHPGVIGIVASRLVERYVRPVLMIAIDGNVGKGSGRSISAFDLHEALSGCSDLLVKFGGHKMAAGLTVDASSIGALRERFHEVTRSALTKEDLVRTQRVDLLLSLDEADDRLERLLNHMQPCGIGNPTPVLGVANVRAAGWRKLGNRHLKLTLDDGGIRLPAIGFNWVDRTSEQTLNGAIDVAFQLDRNEWRGRSELQARIVDIMASEQ